MEWLSGFLDQIILFFQSIWDFMARGIYDFFKDALVVATKAAIYAYFSSLIILLDVSFTVARDLISSLGLSQAIQSGFNSLPQQVSSALSFFGIPQALNILFSALTTRFAMRFVPFIGR